ncbi:MAG: hypothetical protein ACTSW4_00945 [Candidatus Ranarchaeia archaeon]
MPPVETREDIRRVHQRLDDFQKDFREFTNEVSATMAEIKTKIDAMPIQPKQPCIFFEKHLEEHKDTARSWKHAAISGTVKVVITAIVGAFCYFFGTKQ